MPIGLRIAFIQACAAGFVGLMQPAKNHSSLKQLTKVPVGKLSQLVCGSIVWTSHPALCLGYQELGEVHFIGIQFLPWFQFTRHASQS